MPNEVTKPDMRAFRTTQGIVCSQAVFDELTKQIQVTSVGPLNFVGGVRIFVRTSDELDAIDEKLKAAEREVAPEGCGRATIEKMIDARADALAKENAELRQIISDCATKLPFGGAISPSCSVEFMTKLPAEFELQISRTALKGGNYPAIPDGWKLAPVEPTVQMLAAAQSAWLRDPERKSSTIYRAMLSAVHEKKD